LGCLGSHYFGRLAGLVEYETLRHAKLVDSSDGNTTKMLTPRPRL